MAGAGLGLLGVLCTVIARGLTVWTAIEGSHAAAGYLAGELFGYLPIFLFWDGMLGAGNPGGPVCLGGKRQCSIGGLRRYFSGPRWYFGQVRQVLFIAPVMAISVWFATTFL